MIEKCPNASEWHKICYLCSQKETEILHKYSMKINKYKPFIQQAQELLKEKLAECATIKTSFPISNKTSSCVSSSLKFLSISTVIYIWQSHKSTWLSVSKIILCNYTSAALLEWKWMVHAEPRIWAISHIVTLR